MAGGGLDGVGEVMDILNWVGAAGAGVPITPGMALVDQDDHVAAASFLLRWAALPFSA